MAGSLTLALAVPVNAVVQPSPEPSIVAEPEVSPVPEPGKPGGGLSGLTPEVAEPTPSPQPSVGSDDSESSAEHGPGEDVEQTPLVAVPDGPSPSFDDAGDAEADATSDPVEWSGPNIPRVWLT